MWFIHVTSLPYWIQLYTLLYSCAESTEVTADSKCLPRVCSPAQYCSHYDSKIFVNKKCVELSSGFLIIGTCLLFHYISCCVQCLAISKCSCRLYVRTFFVFYLLRNFQFFPLELLIYSTNEIQEITIHAIWSKMCSSPVLKISGTKCTYIH